MLTYRNNFSMSAAKSYRKDNQLARCSRWTNGDCPFELGTGMLSPVQWLHVPFPALSYDDIHNRVGWLKQQLIIVLLGRCLA
jgi:hypothetical protein